MPGEKERGKEQVSGNVPRKLLIVRREPPDEGFNIMLEVAERTHTYQVTEAAGIEILDVCIDQIAVIVQRGIGRAKAA